MVIGMQDAVHADMMCLQTSGFPAAQFVLKITISVCFQYDLLPTCLQISALYQAVIPSYLSFSHAAAMSSNASLPRSGRVRNSDPRQLGLGNKLPVTPTVAPPANALLEGGGQTSRYSSRSNKRPAPAGEVRPSVSHNCNKDACLSKMGQLFPQFYDLQ